MAIDRAALVARHRITLTCPDALAPLSVGNGEFAFTADITGLQTFPAFHEQGLAQFANRMQSKPFDPTVVSMPIHTQAQWGWHSMPNPEGYTLEDTLTAYETARGPVTYPDRYDFMAALRGGAADQAAGTWLANNPQRLDLGQIGLDLRHGEPEGASAQIEDLSATEQTLDMWQGLLESRFQFAGEPVRVLTVAHPTLDLVAVRIESPLLADGRLAVKIAFPYASTGFATADWSVPERHQTEYAPSDTGCTFTRTLDDDRYFCALAWSEGGTFNQTGEHQFQLAATGTGALAFVMAFAPEPISTTLPSFDEAREAAAAHWAQFWQQGGAVDLSGSTDPRAHELERRIVLSQYLTAVNCAGSTPPQESGLVCNSWKGKFHLEMHWWHAAHFALWGRPQLLEKSLPWYTKTLPVAQAIAQRQGYRGARWPKEVGPDGREAPGTIGPFLIWQQPHPIYYAELLWRAHQNRETLERYRELVFETATFMASFAAFDGERYTLASPLLPAQEFYDRTTVVNPTFELAYWYWGLETAQRWRERLGMEREPAWEQVKNGLAVPTPRDGIYPAIETEPYTMRNDHPSLLMALGFVPQTPLIDPEVMQRTLENVKQDWDWPSTWGWDYPVLAMCAARLGDGAGAVDGLLMPMPKNSFLPNGHNMQMPVFVPLYLPANGGLLAAVALMAAGWDGAPTRPAPGFPDDGSWVVQVEGIAPLP
jgi:hypothetical protein